MSTPNPLAPQGSLLEQQGRGKSTLQIITFIGALHVFFLCGLLWIGCKKDDKAQNPVDPLAGNPPLNTGADTNLTGTPPGGYVANPVVPLVSTGAPPLVALPPNTVVVPPVVIPPVAEPGAAGNVGGAATAASEYKVQKGDIGTSIARKHNVTLAALKAANPTVKWNALKIDQRIQIPASDGTKPTTGGATGTTGASGGTTGTTADAAGGTSYEVKPGDTGSKIAHKFGVSWKSIRAANQLSNDNIRPKQKLTIPAKAAGGGTAPTTVPTDVLPPAVPTVPTASPVVSPAPIGTPGRN